MFFCLLGRQPTSLLCVCLNRKCSSWERVFSETTIVVNQPTSLRHGRAFLLWRKEDSKCLVAMPVENTRSQLEGFGETEEELRRSFEGASAHPHAVHCMVVGRLCVSTGARRGMGEKTGWSTDVCELN